MYLLRQGGGVENLKLVPYELKYLHLGTPSQFSFALLVQVIQARRRKKTPMCWRLCFWINRTILRIFYTLKSILLYIYRHHHFIFQGDEITGHGTARFEGRGPRRSTGTRWQLRVVRPVPASWTWARQSWQRSVPAVPGQGCGRRC